MSPIVYSDIQLNWSVEQWLDDLRSGDEVRQKSAIVELYATQPIKQIVRKNLNKFLIGAGHQKLFDEIWDSFEERLIKVDDLLLIMETFVPGLGNLPMWLSRRAVFHARDMLKNTGFRDRIMMEVASSDHDAQNGTNDPLENAVQPHESEADSIPREAKKTHQVMRTETARNPGECDKIREAINSVSSRAQRAVAVLYLLKFSPASKVIRSTWSEKKLRHDVSNVMYRNDYDLVLDTSKYQEKGQHKEVVVDYHLNELNRIVEQRINEHRVELKRATNKVGAKNFLVRQELNNASYLRKQLHAHGIDESRLFAIQQWASGKTVQQIRDNAHVLVENSWVIREYCLHFRRLQERRKNVDAAIRDMESSARGGPMPNNEEMATVLKKTATSVGQDKSRVMNYIRAELERLYGF